MERSILEQAGLASGLLSEEQLERAWHLLAESLPRVGVSLEEISDEQLADQLIELGYLNRWQAEQLKEGRTKFNLGAYRILDAIGYGGMGWVFKCEHALLGRVEAVKVLPKSQTNPVSIANFLKEIRAQAQLDHPNLVRLTYADTDGETYFLVTEYVAGSDLRKLVHHHGPLTQQQAATIVSQGAKALAYVHSRGLIHRDIKPGNFLITQEGKTKVADLGLAYFYAENSESSSEKPKHIVGTADYLAPEIVVTPGVLRTVSDIYSLGCTLYYAVTGKVPFPGGNTAEKLRRQLEEAPLPPQRFNPEITNDFAEVVSAMMQKRPEDRIKEAEQVVELLQPWVEAEESVAQEIGALTHFNSEDSVNVAWADTLPDIVPPEQTNGSEPKSNPPSLRHAKLPQAVATGQQKEHSNTAHGESSEEGLPSVQRLIQVMVTLAVVVAVVAVYLVISSLE